MKKKIALRSVIPAQAGISLLALTLLVACGDTVENVYQTGLEAYASEDDLPKCNKEHENELAFVKDAGVTLVCVDGDWVATSPESTGNVDFSCKTEELKDKSGLKIVCNGDSIGVVLNGSDGKDGEKGDKGDDGVDGKDGEDAGMTQSDTTVNDSEKVAISLDSLAGYTQKGPFLKGSTVYLYELSDGRTLKQTNGNFTSKITRDDGHYKFTARDLVSQYAMLVVDGFYRNEVTGRKSDASLRLTALTDMRKRSSANVNLLTHLEFDRVYQLVTRGDSTGKKLTVKQAKRQAQKEILKQFHIELDSTTDAEDMDAFGSSDADAALLAVSILLQGDSGTTDLSVLLTEISNDIAEYGEWKNDSAKAAIADWVFSKVLSSFRRNVEGWGLNGDNEIGDFENVIEHFIMGTYDVKNCGNSEDYGNEGTVKNKYSKQDGQTIACFDGKLAVKRTHEYFNPGVEYGEMVDWRERRLYKTVTIDGQTWMAENLDLDYKVEGSTYGTYTNTDNGETYGRYYTWAAAMDSAGVYSDNSKGCGYGKTCAVKTPARGICPEGWHIPTPVELKALYSAIGGSRYAMQAKGFDEWPDATDAYGFSALPAGSYYDGRFFSVGSYANFWSAEENRSNHANYWYLNEGSTRLDYNEKGNSYSVRCLKD